MPAMSLAVPTLLTAVPAHGLLRLTGADRSAFLHNLTTADVKGLAPGRGLPAVIVNQRAQVLDWVGVHADDDALWVATGPCRAAEVLAWLDKYLITEDVAITDESAAQRRFFVTGRDAAAAVGVAPWTVCGTAIGGRPVRVLGAQGWGGPGYLLEAAPADAEGVVDALTAAGARSPDAPELEYWRVAAGVPAVGHELTAHTNPWEARLDAAISLAKGCYLGQEVVARLQAYDKVQRLLVGVEVPAGVTLAAGDAVLAPDDPAGERPLGALTSVAAAPDGPPAVLALVKRTGAEPGTGVMVRNAGGEKISANLADRWFWAP